MQIEIKIDESRTEPRIIIETANMTEELSELVRRLSETAPPVLVGFRGELAEIIEPESLVRIYASNGKVFAETDRGEYTLRLRLYEAEQRLDSRRFVRVSHSELVNLKKVKGFDLSFAGTVCVLLTNGTSAYVSRRYVSKIKQRLGL